jgi:hypothetical protein
MKSIKQFCEKNDISRSALYKLWHKGVGPDVLRNGGKIWISDQAEARWIAANEAPWSRSSMGGNWRSKAGAASTP